jgi:hypothetical protein
MADPVDTGAVTWLVLVYQLPAKPRGPGTTVRRKLDAAGAVHLTRGARRAHEAAFAVAGYRSALDDCARGLLGGGTGYLLP